MRDEDLPAVIRSLGLEGIIDIHVHAMPQRLLDAVWGVFDRAEDVYGTPWPIRYRLPDAQRLDLLASFGVVRHTALNYAHRPGVAEGLNAWSEQYAHRHAQVIHSATFYPEASAQRYVAEAISAGAQVFKIHVEVGGFDLGDARLDPVWGLLQDSGSTVVAHAGSAPRASPYTGPEPVERLLRRFPRLRLVIAHLGMPETADFLALANLYPALGFDTTMVGTDFLQRQWPLDPALLPRIRTLGLADRVFFGSDFPNIPYAYAHQVAALQRWELGDDWMRAVLWGAGQRRYGL